MESNDLSMEEKTRARAEEKRERENKGFWLSWMVSALESCGIWSNHVKVEPLKEIAAEEGQTASLKVHEAKV